MKINNKAKPLTEIGGHARQGDTLLRRIKQIPVDTESLQETKKCVLALGEITGHSHTFTEGAIGFVRPGLSFDSNEALADFVRVQEETELEHQEHDAIRYPAGDFESFDQVEYTPEAIRRVAD